MYVCLSLYYNCIFSVTDCIYMQIIYQTFCISLYFLCSILCTEPLHVNMVLKKFLNINVIAFLNLYDIIGGNSM